MRRDILLIQNQEEMRVIVGVMLGVEGDDEAVKTRACERLSMNPTTTTLLPAHRPEPDQRELAKLRRQYFRFLELEDVDDEEDVLAFIQVYQRLREAGATLPQADVLMIESFLHYNGARESEDREEDDPPEDEGDWEREAEV
jgi:hypothetical protein